MIVSSKHPKSRHYAGSESLEVRVSSAVAQKNEGTLYLVDVNKQLQLSPGEETLKVIPAFFPSSFLLIIYGFLGHSELPS